MSDDEEPSLESVDSFLRAAAAAPARSGATLGEGARLGHFVLERLLGQGGTGSVYLARDERIERRVAVKVLSAEDYGEPERRRLLREARAAARVDHPRVATIYEVAEAEGRTYLAMEYVDGESLRARLARGPLPRADALRIARALTDGVAAAHERGVIHRDLKPENILMTNDGDVRIVDFGLAKATTKNEGDPSDTTTGAGEMVGTVGYMSPEQAAGLPVDARSDVFSLGVVMHELLSGRRPFEGRTRMEVVVATTRDPAATLEVAEAPWITEIVARCLAKDPGGRYASAGVLLAALDRGPATETERRRSRRRGLLLVAVSVAAGAIALAAMSARDRSERPHLELSVASAVAVPAIASSFVVPSAPVPPEAVAPALPSRRPVGAVVQSQPRVAASAAPSSAPISVNPLEDQK